MSPPDLRPDLSLAMGGIVWLAYQVLGSWFEGPFIKQCTALGLLIGLGISAYAILILAMKATSISELKSGFRKG